MVTTNLMDVIAQGQKALDGWKAIDPNLAIGSLKPAESRVFLFAQQASISNRCRRLEIVLLIDFPIS